jgi:hypothetical protein
VGAIALGVVLVLARAGLRRLRRLHAHGFNLDDPKLRNSRFEALRTTTP